MIKTYRRFVRKTEYAKVVLYDGTYEAEEEVYKLFMESNVIKYVSHSVPRFKSLINKLIDILERLHKGTYFILFENGDFSAVSESRFKDEGFICDSSLTDLVESIEEDGKSTSNEVSNKAKPNKKKNKKYFEDLVKGE